MTVNVVVQISCQVGGKIIGNAVKILEGLPESGRLISHRFNADYRARRPVDTCRKHNLSLFNRGSNAHARKDSILQAWTATPFVKRGVRDRIPGAVGPVWYEGRRWRWGRISQQPTRPTASRRYSRLPIGSGLASPCSPVGCGRININKTVDKSGISADSSTVGKCRPELRSKILSQENEEKVVNATEPVRRKRAGRKGFRAASRSADIPVRLDVGMSQSGQECPRSNDPTNSSQIKVNPT